MKTRAAVVTESGSPIAVLELRLAEPREGEVLVRVAAAGICHSDWHLVTGDTAHPLPAVLGHEGAGVVEAVGAGVTKVAPGDRVALNWAPYCGTCFLCKKGSPALCRTYVGPLWAGTMLDGTPRFALDDGRPVYHYCGLACFADRTVVPEPCCVPVPDAVPFEIAALIGCAVTTGAGAILNTAALEPGESVVVLGAGGVGLSAVMAARMVGCDPIIVVDRAAAKLEMAADFGASHAVAAGSGALEKVRELTDGFGADCAIEAVGHPQAQATALEATRSGGRCVLVGLAPMGSTTELDTARLVREEKAVLGSYYGSCDPERDFPLLCDHYASGRLPLDRLVSRRWALEEVNDAYAAMLSGEIARGVIAF
ncbi:MAG: alcohol dehydrogenase [Planctomycetes bacterium]|nr:alcohol dehydrogenase [Planctomycetota bacterium]